ncbi:MAG: thiamine-phosphate kinase [bacterium]|nr:thiamine-phosphate kinase [bacterium]
MPIKSEWKLLDKIGETIGSRGLPCPRDLTTAIGDDCAVFRIGPDRYGIFTTDISIESTHFIIGKSSPQNIGYKAMSANISDIAAMGGKSRFAFVSLGVPPHIEEEFILSLYNGMLEAAGSAGTVISGGDTSRSRELVLNIALYGEVSGRKPVLRDGAQTGDTIYLTGTTGDSMAGLELVMEENKDLHKEFRSLIEKHTRPTARFSMVDFILKNYSPTSMIDISDGLLSDLGHIAEKSGKGFLLNKEKLPVSEDLKKYSLLFNKDPYKFVLESGEEYELLFTSSKKAALESGVPITSIGTITDSGFSLSINGIKKDIAIRGFDHFK